MVKTISPKLLKEKLEKGEVFLIDVREPGEHASEAIHGATLLPLGEICCEKITAPDGTLVVHCRSGKRSTLAYEKLLAENPNLDIYNLEGGIAAWIAEGYEVKKSGRKVLPLDRQTQIVAGSVVLTGVTLGFLVHPGFFGLSGFVGAGLIFAGISGWCGTTQLLAKMPWNK
jgi:rhodanese-related sulfurtransferase